MLVLTRNERESIRIGDIQVIVYRIEPGRVKLAIDAPKSVPVHREENYWKLKRQKP